MPPAPPSFGSQEYWNKRFASNSSPFEWLEAPTALDSYLIAALKECSEPEPELLHIGCGTSLLSYHLRAHVPNPERVHNLDYSEIAIEVGRKREVDIFQEEPALLHDKESEPSQTAAAEPPKPSYMRWSTANLLSHSSLLAACRPSAYSIIVDKSTSDSIACSEDVHVPLPYHITTCPSRSGASDLTESPEPIHPLHIMAVHLALLTKPKGRWISLSYSMDRYPFLSLPPPDPEPTSSGPAEANPLARAANPTQTSTTAITPAPAEREYDTSEDDDMSLDDDLDDIPQKVIDNGFPDPSILWRLVGKYDIEPPPPPPHPSNGSSSNSVIHRPKVMHWIYVLERTDVGVSVRR